MAACRFSSRAETDLIEVGNYTVRLWGEEQALRYIADLETICQQLAETPGLGRACNHMLPGLKRMEHAQHVVFYRKEPGGISITRILHRRMLPERQAMAD